MAGDWLKVEKSTPEKPEVMAVAALLNVSLGDAFLGCFRVWCWADLHTKNGHLLYATPQAVDSIARLPGLSDALIKIGWLQVRENSLAIPNFDRHMGHSAKQRVDAAERQREHRNRHASVTECHSRIPRGLRRQVLARDKHECVYCGFKAGKRTPAGDYVGASLGVDHVIPVSRGGVTSLDNLVACCTVCNNSKNNRTPEEAGLAWPNCIPKPVTKNCDSSSLLSASSGTDPPEEKTNSAPPGVGVQGEGGCKCQPASDLFDEFWAAFPRKEAKQAARKAWGKLRPDAGLLGQMLEAIEQQKAWKAWLEGFIPHPATWLNGRRWEDEAPPAVNGSIDHFFRNVKDT